MKTAAILKKCPVEISQRQQELFGLRDFYSGDEWREQDLLFLSQALMFACFPYRKIAEQSFTKKIKIKGGVLRVTVTAVKKGVALPYGKDRVVVACALTKARQKGRPAVTFEEIDSLLREFGEDYRQYGGADYERLRERLERLRNCAIVIEREGNRDGEKIEEGQNSFIVAKYRMPSRKRGPRRLRAMTLEPDGDLSYAIQFGAEFWEDYKRYCVPMPVPLMQLFADEPKAWDIAQLVHWASYAAIQSERLGGTGRKIFTWQDMLHIMGSVDSNPRRLRQTIPSVLAEMRTVWPEMNATFETSGDLVIGVPHNHKLLVQPSQYAEKVRETIEKSLPAFDFTPEDGNNGHSRK